MKYSKAIPDFCQARIIQDGFMTAHTGPFWEPPPKVKTEKPKTAKKKAAKPKTELTVAERIKFDHILERMCSPEYDYSTLNYVTGNHQFSGSHASWSKEIVQDFCYMLNNSMDGLHKLMQRDCQLFELFSQCFQANISPDKFRKIIDYSQRIDYHLLNARDCMQYLIPFIEEAPQKEEVQSILDPCRRFIIAVTEANSCIQNWKKIFTDEFLQKDSRELKKLRKKLPGYTQKIHTLEQITESQAETNRNLTARIGKGVITQEDMAAIIVKAGTIAGIKKYQHCTRETISHWENNIGCPLWYSKSFRFWDPAKVVEMIADGMKEELAAKKERANRRKARVYREDRDKKADSEEEDQEYDE